MNQRETVAHVEQDIYTKMFVATLFIIEENTREMDVHQIQNGYIMQYIHSKAYKIKAMKRHKLAINFK